MGKQTKEKQERGGGAAYYSGASREVEQWCYWIVTIGAFLVLLTPLLFIERLYFPFISSKAIYFMAIAQVMTAAWAILAWHVPKYRPSWNMLTGALLVFLGAMVASMMTGVEPERSFWSYYERMTGVLFWAHIAALFVVLSSTFRTKEEWVRLFTVSIGIAIPIALWGLAERHGMVERMSDRDGIIFGNTTFWSMYVSFHAFFALYLFFAGSRNLRRYFGAAFLLLATAVVIGPTTAAMLSMIAAGAVFGVLYLLFAMRARWAKAAGALALIALVIGGGAITYMLFQEDSAVQRAFVDESPARLVVWELSWNAFLERPVFGWGPENYQQAFALYFNPCFFAENACGGSLWFDRAHNVVLDTLVMLGAVGLAAYAGIFLAALYLLWMPYIRNGERQQSDFWFPAIFTALLVSYVVQNLSAFDTITSLVFFAIVLAVIAGLRHVQQEGTAAAPRPFSWVAGGIVGALWLFAFLVFTIQPYQSGILSTQAIQNHAGTPQRMEALQKALETSPVGNEQLVVHHVSPNTARVLEDDERAARVPQEWLMQEADFVIAELEAVIERNPLDFRAHLMLGQVANGVGRFDGTYLVKAEEALERAMELSPNHPQPHWDLAQTRLRQDRLDDAMELLVRAAQLEPRYYPAHYRIVLVMHQVLEQPELARQRAEEAIAINPEWERNFNRFFESVDR